LSTLPRTDIHTPTGEADQLKYFRLRPIKAAKVSEISETTTASPVPPEERVNFHIGNPVQDERLVWAYCRIALGLDPHTIQSATPTLDDFEEELGGEVQDRDKLEFLLRLIRKSAPYMPRGGFQRSNPNDLIKFFSEWLQKGQPDPLVYDLGEKSGVREVILASGGISEAFRVLFQALNEYLIFRPAAVLLHGLELPPHLHEFEDILVESLPEEEHHLLTEVRRHLANAPSQPTFLVLGRIVHEETRRHLRQICTEHPLFVIEANDAPNSLSLAREARMSQRVLRFLTPAIFSPRLAALSTVFIAGNPDFVSIIEVAHFGLKGTPSAPEVELLTLLLSKTPDKGADVHETVQHLPAAESLPFGPQKGNALARHAGSMAELAETIIDGYTDAIGTILTTISDKSVSLAQSVLDRLQRVAPMFDQFAGNSFNDLFDGLIGEGISAEWAAALSDGFLSAFLKHHPEYDRNSSSVVSGSSRTALGLLGQHCGIREVVTPDLSWTYEQCFPRVTAIPLTEDFQLDVNGILRAVEWKIAEDPHWKSYGAVALNNPHNATGQAFPEADIRTLLLWLLERKVFVLDDLAYQNVVPSIELRGPKTLRQLTEDLVRAGYLSSESGDYLLTVHSVSKTDCLAGSRLAVVEIRHGGLRGRFTTVNATVAPNVAAIFLSYLFYRRRAEDTNAYWRLRNAIFEERMSALEQAANNLPAERNRYTITIRRPTGSMYPLLMIERLPSGLSLDWLSSGLARQGIGLLPLSAFARTEKGFDTGRKAFRLTLGGTDTADRLFTKTRRVLIDLNRMMAEEESRYNRRSLPRHRAKGADAFGDQGIGRGLAVLDSQIRDVCKTLVSRQRPFSQRTAVQEGADPNTFLTEYLPERLAILRQRVHDRTRIASMLLGLTAEDGGKSLEQWLDQELYKDNLGARQQRFRRRLFDRTVHPTQMYSIQVEILWEEAIRDLLRSREVGAAVPHSIAAALLGEYAGTNVAISSEQEGDELLLDLDSLLAAEDILRIHADTKFRPFLSYWGDWDGSTRPSGQGHRLVATVLLENVRRLAHLLRMLLQANPSLHVDRPLVQQVEKLEANVRDFRKLLDEITFLTHQLEGRYRGVLPFQLTPTPLRRAGMRLHLARDPLTSLWQHNDRLERRMVTLRAERKQALQYYFALNKGLRKALHALIPAIRTHGQRGPLALEATLYRDLLKRVVITPRIHQKLITAQDQFAIDTTVHNITEINEIAGSYGNPGMILGLQISMATTPNALVSVDRKLRARREETLRRDNSSDVAPVWLIPLFEDLDAVKGIGDYLGKIWEYSLGTRKLNQETRDRFAEILPEVFIAGSDLSQQVGQTAGSTLFREAKFQVVSWLAERGLVGDVRIKMGSGEPMQRQGGYYAPQSGLPAFSTRGENAKRLAATLPASTKKSVEYATTPLMGVFAASDLRTFQSNLAEQLRALPVEECARLLLHVYQSQRFYERELARAAEPLIDTRLKFTARGLQELERLTAGKRDSVFDTFVQLSTENFKHIVYGKDEDVVGIHLISYFIARTTPPLRDRPTFRPGRGLAETSGHQILEKIAETIPLSKYGSLLRAIAHNQAQTAVLGVNQLTTGMFRAFHLFSARQFPEGSGASLLGDRVLPHLPVYEILHTLRLYHDVDQTFLRAMENAFPAGNSAFAALREDIDAMDQYLGLLRRELIRRHGLSVPDFFDRDEFHTALLPTVRPDLAVLLQPDLFNTDADILLSQLRGTLDPAWVAEVGKLLRTPRMIKLWRSRAWKLLHEPVFGRVQSFVELALALASLSVSGSAQASPFRGSLTRKIRLATPKSEAAGTLTDDSLRQFLGAASEYLTELSQHQLEVPTTVVRALKEVERIMKIEEQALTIKQQEELRFYLLQIARLAGENG
jgi:aspartate/methionine/tyrosine aminotransferase